MAEAPLHTSMDESSFQEPFFLVGAERSGTTLLRLMIDHHPLIRFRFESNFLVDYLTSAGGDPDPAELEKKLAIDRGARLHGFKVGEGLGYKEGVRQFLFHDAHQQGKSVFGAALHRRFADILHIFPNARFLNLVRDPRDVAPSVIAMGWSGNTWHASKLWINAQQEAQRLCDSLPSDRWHTLRFEDLVCKPEETLTAVSEFLGCKFDPAMLSYPEDTTYPAPDASASQRWRKKMPTKDVQLVEACVGEWLQKAGYEPSGESPRQVSNLQQSLLNIQNRFGRFRFRTRRFGFFTVVGFALSSRLGMHKTANRLQLKMQAHENSLLR
ncbi:MAG: sulfotransferase [Planctomycetes bacterium]|nr:sulfotransferase [Planctomycetota bacterium]MCP4771003.1 sulfotransferase [Planctomycetota bacterium]